MPNKKIVILFFILLLLSFISMSGFRLFPKKHHKASGSELSVTAQEILEQAEQAYKNDEFAKSLKFYQEFIDLNFFTKSENSRYIYMTAHILDQNLNMPEDALKIYLKLISSYPLNEDTEPAYIYAAQIYTDEGYYLKAINLLDKYRKKVGFSAFSEKREYLTGFCHFKLGQFGEAVQALSEIRKMENPDPWILYDTYAILASIFWKQYNDREKAYEYLQNLFSLNIKKADYPHILLLYKRIRWKYISRKDGLRDNTISSIAFDGDEIWFGQWLGGVARYSRSRDEIRFYTYKEGVVSSLIRDIKVDHDQVWVATIEGISRYNKASGKWQKFVHIPGISYPKIKSILNTESYVWFATLGHRLWRYDKTRKTWFQFTDLPRNLVKIRLDPYEGLIGVASYNRGMYVFDSPDHYEKYRKSDSSGLESDEIKDIVFSEDYIYAASYTNGIYRKGRSGEKFHLVKIPGFEDKKLYINTIRWKNHKLYIGTIGNGIIITDLEHTEQISIFEGMTSDSVMTIEFENDYIWIGTIDDGVNILYYP